MDRTRRALLVSLLLILALAGQAIASSATDAQANRPQVAGDATSNTTARFPTSKQNEPTIAIAPDGTTALAGANDEQDQPPCGPGPVRGPGALASDCSFFPGVGTSGVYRSTDGGSTWTNLGLLPGYADTANVAPSAGALTTSAAPGTLVSDGDPVIAFGPKPGASGFSWSNGTRAYYANLASFAAGARNAHTAPEVLAVSISDDLGRSWSDPVQAVMAKGQIFNDKEAIWADRSASSPHFGRVYLSWTQFRDIPGCAEPVMFSFSTDGGLTWSNPDQLSVARNCGIGGRQGSTIRTGPDGTVYVFWEDSDQVGPIQVVQVSHDGGASFSKSVTVGRLSDLDDPIPGANFRDSSFPAAAVDQTSGAVYDSWATKTSAGGRVVVAKSLDQGQTWTAETVSRAAEGYAFFQGIDVAPNGRVDVAYQALKAIDPTTFGTGNASIDSYYVSSSDGGVSWSAPLKVSTHSSDPAASAQNNLRRQFWGDYNTLASTNAFALFIYTDTRNGVGCAPVDSFQKGAASKPAPENVCAGQFGNSDVFVSKILP